MERHPYVVACPELGGVWSRPFVEHGSARAAQTHLLSHGDAAPVLRRPGQKQACEGLLSPSVTTITNDI